MSLPILSAQFFDKHSPDLGFFSKWRSFYQWSDQILPVYEWNDVLYVACLQPPAKFPPTTQKIVFLLCDHESLKRVWYSFEGTVVYQRAPSLNVAPPAIAGSKPLLDLPISLGDEEPAPTFSLAEKKEHKEATFSIAAEESTIEETAEEPVESFKLDFGNEEEEVSDVVIPTLDMKSDEPVESTIIDEISEEIVVEEVIEDVAAPEKPIALESSDDLKLDFSVAVDEKIDEKTPIPIQIQEPTPAPAAESLKPSAQAQATPALAAKPAAAADPNDMFANINVPSAPGDSITSLLEDGPNEEVALAGHESAEGGSGADADLLDLTGSSGTPETGTGTGTSTNPLVSLQPIEPLSNAAEPTPMPQQQPAAVAKSVTPAEKRATPVKTEAVAVNSDVTRISINTLNSVPQEKMDPWMEKLFSELGAHYEKSMILLKSGDQIKPWRWSSQFAPTTPSITSVTLLQPSPFRIVHRTHKPFHGYVVPNDLNNKFFAQWNNAQTPEHLTIAPVMVKDHVIGMLLAIGAKTADTKACLHLTESLANSIAAQIKSGEKAA